jgi:hypothetical protein
MQASVRPALVHARMQRAPFSSLAAMRLKTQSRRAI